MIMLDQFLEHFNKLQLGFGKTLSQNQLDFWFEEVREKDHAALVETCKRLKYGDKFPNPKMFLHEYRNVEQTLGNKAGTPDEVPSCQWCDHGKIFLEKDQGNGLWSQPYVFRCGECDPWQFKQFHPMYPARLDEYIAKGWRPDWNTQDKWKKVAAGTWEEEDDTVSPNLTRGLVKGLGYGKEDKAKEAKRQAIIEAVEGVEIPF